ncbi:MAG: hypothetical protein ACE5KI_08065, partial [Dehalococcoidia bacterium]
AFWAIFVLFYTTLFTNPGQGLGSGLWQSLGYWIAQQDVRRGAQPWYYYGLLSGAYEFLAVSLVLFGVVWYLWSRGKGRKGRLWLVQGFLAAVLILLLLSPFWMPVSTGYQLVLGILFLGVSTSLLIYYIAYVDRSFLRSRWFVADAALIALFLLNWVLPRIVDIRDLPVFSHLWDARNPLVVVILGLSMGVITFKSMGREDRFTWFLVYWLALSLVLYGFAAEKMPWLMVHTALPLAILAGKIVGGAVERVEWRPRLDPRWALGFVGVLVVGLLSFQTIRVSVEATYGLDREGTGDVPLEMLVYTQTSPDITETLARIDALALATGKDAALPIVVDRTSGFEWPWRWYLRDYTNVQWPCYDNNPNDATCRPMEQAPDADVVIIHHKNQAASAQFLGDFDEGQRIRHRAWFPEFETYKENFAPLPLEGFFESLVSADSWRQWWDFFAFRKLETDKPLGSEDSVVFFRQQDTASSESQLK